MEEDRELQTLEKELKIGRQQVTEQRALRESKTRTKRLELSRKINLTGVQDDEDAKSNPASPNIDTSKATGPNNGLAKWSKPKQPSADSWIEEELNHKGMPPVVTGSQVGAPWMASLMPQFEFPKFNGDPRQWIEFMASFKSLAHDVVPGNALRMGVLRQKLYPNV